MLPYYSRRVNRARPRSLPRSSPLRHLERRLPKSKDLREAIFYIARYVTREEASAQSDEVGEGAAVLCHSRGAAESLL